MTKHRPPGYQLPRLVVRPWMWAAAALLWCLVTAAAVAREVPALGVGFCIGFAVVCAWVGGRLTSDYENEERP